MSDKKFQNRFRTASVRAQWHEYNCGAYFITICTQNREHYFGLITDDKMLFSEIGVYADECIRNIELLHDNVFVPVYQVMPDHIHMIIIVDSFEPTAIVQESDSERTKTISGNAYMRHVACRCGKLSHIISRFKTAVSRFANQKHIPFAWQSRFHDHIIRNEDEMKRIEKYIQNNVINL